MPIKIFSDRIEIGDKIITATPTGIRIDDSLLANTQNNRIASTNFTAKEIISANSFSSSFTASAFQGTVAGYQAGGIAGPGNVNTIDKFPFASLGTATDVGDISSARNSASGISAPGAGYAVSAAGSPGNNTIDKYPFASDTNATDIGDLFFQAWGTNAESSDTHGYQGGTYAPGNNPAPMGGGGYINNLCKFPFASDTNASDIGDMVVGTFYACGLNSATDGYVMGGGNSASRIQRFPFSTDSNATLMGICSFGANYVGISSSVNGYNVANATMNKLSFVNDTFTVGVNMFASLVYGSGVNSGVDSGYRAGGYISTTPAPLTINIDKFPFVNDTNSVDVGDLSQTRAYSSGAQN